MPKSVKAALRLSDLVRAQGVILRSLGDSLCIAPPLIIEEQDIDVIIAAIATALDLLEAELTAEGVFNG